MRVYIQWAQADPQEWVLLDLSTIKAIRDLPRKSEPTGTEPLDNQPGWVNAVNCQGIIFAGYDHLGFQPESGGLRITGWNDDTEDFGDTRWATSWLLRPPAPDPALGGRPNTVQERTVYATPDAAVWFPGVPVLPWSEFRPPPTNLTLHGVWLDDTLFLAHHAKQALHGWMEWAT